MKKRNDILIIFILCVLSQYSCTRNQPIIAGEVEALEVDVGIKVAGRIASISVHEGDMVQKDEVVGRMESKELDAKFQTATAAHEEAKKQFEFAKQTFDRLDNLFKKAVIPKQQFDEGKYKYEAAKQKVQATEGQLNEVKAYYEELSVKSPIDGEIIQIVSNVGEIVSPGYPVVTVLDPNDQWVTFYLREDLLKNVKKDQIISVSFPALGKGKNHAFKITYISSLGAFAKWKSTNEQGSFDLKTFQIKARSDENIPDLRPGMTALVKLGKGSKI